MDIVLTCVINCPSRWSLFTIHLWFALCVDHLSIIPTERRVGYSNDSHLCGHGQQRGDAQGNSSRNRSTVQPERDLEDFLFLYLWLTDEISKLWCLLMLAISHPWDNDEHARRDVDGEQIIGELPLENHQDLNKNVPFDFLVQEQKLSNQRNGKKKNQTLRQLYSPVLVTVLQ